MEYPILPTLLVTSRPQSSWPWDAFLCICLWASTLFGRPHRSCLLTWDRSRFFSVSLWWMLIRSPFGAFTRGWFRWNGGFGSFCPFLVPDVDGLGVFLIPEGPGWMMTGATVSFLMISFSDLSKGASIIPSGSSVPRNVKGPVLPVRIRFTNRPCSEERGLVIFTATLSGNHLSFRMRCSSAAKQPALFSNAFSVIYPL